MHLLALVGACDFLSCQACSAWGIHRFDGVEMKTSFAKRCVAKEVNGSCSRLCEDFFATYSVAKKIGQILFSHWVCNDENFFAAQRK